MRSMNRRRFLSLSVLVPLGAAGCRGEGFSILGYQLGTRPLYDTNISTVYVPLFNNRAFQWTPFRRIEVDITREVVRAIGQFTPYRVTSDCERADTELLGNVVNISKNLLNRNQQNQVREGEILVQVDVVWRDLRDGTILSNPRPGPGSRGRNPGSAVDVPPISFDPAIPPRPDQQPLENAVPVRLTATGRYIPELGETNASAAQRVEYQLAVQIVSMMEKKWG